METTYHAIRGTKYQGAGWTITGPEVDGWLPIRTADGVSYFARPCDLFATEAEARAETAARRKPRQPRTPRPLYGDYAQLAQLLGFSTDGTGRRTR